MRPSYADSPERPPGPTPRTERDATTPAPAACRHRDRDRSPRARARPPPPRPPPAGPPPRPAPPSRAAPPAAPPPRALPVAGVAPSALRASRVLPGGRALPHTLADALAPERRPAVLTAPLAPAATGIGRFDLVAVSWQRSQPGTAVQVRVREGGTWTSWEPLDAGDDGPDAGTEGAGGSDPKATAPLLTGGADAVQVRVDTATGTPPSGLRVDLVDGGRAAADAGPATPPGS